MCVFQSIKEALDNVQSSVESAEVHQDQALANANPEDGVRIAELMAHLRTQWASANTQYNDRNRYVNTLTAYTVSLVHLHN